MEGYSKACCEIPPVLPANEYNVKGKYETIDGTKTYVTGPSDASLGIIYIYDIFAYFPQSLQGADILSIGDKHHPYQVFMPDFFPEPCQMAWYPPDTEEKQAHFGAWMGKFLNPPGAAAKLPDLVKSYGAFNPNIKKWAVIGFCWGGKVVALALREGTPFTVGASSSPAMVDGSDAPKIVAPICFLPSKEEPVDDVKAFVSGLKVDYYHKTFDEEVHGWMSARASLEVGTVSEKAYEEGYEAVLNFFGKHMTVTGARL